MDCYACDAAAINACKRCAQPYCDDHGNAAYCADCLKPASALPSFNLYRGALLVMLVGTALAIVLIVRPPGETKGAVPVIAGRLSPTATQSSGTPEPSVRAETPETTETVQTTGTLTIETPGNAAATTGTPEPSTPTPLPSPTPGLKQYTVQEGDSVASIAAANLPPGANLKAYQDAIIALNNLDSSSPILHPEQVLALPPAPP